MKAHTYTLPAVCVGYTDTFYGVISIMDRRLFLSGDVPRIQMIIDSVAHKLKDKPADQQLKIIVDSYARNGYYWAQYLSNEILRGKEMRAFHPQHEAFATW